MDRFIHSQNLRRYSDLLRSETDAAKRATLHTQLIQEEDQFAAREERLDCARDHIEELSVRIVRQEALIRLLKGNGHDCTAAEQLHAAWCETLAILERYRQTLEIDSEGWSIRQRWV
jgi:hypothetical protein